MKAYLYKRFSVLGVFCLVLSCIPTRMKYVEVIKPVETILTEETILIENIETFYEDFLKIEPIISSDIIDFFEEEKNFYFVTTEVFNLDDIDFKKFHPNTEIEKKNTEIWVRWAEEIRIYQVFGEQFKEEKFLKLEKNPAIDFDNLFESFEILATKINVKRREKSEILPEDLSIDYFKCAESRAKIIQNKNEYLVVFGNQHPKVKKYHLDFKIHEKDLDILNFSYWNQHQEEIVVLEQAFIPATEENNGVLYVEHCSEQSVISEVKLELKGKNGIDIEFQYFDSNAENIGLIKLSGLGLQPRIYNITQLNQEQKLHLVNFNLLNSAGTPVGTIKHGSKIIDQHNKTIYAEINPSGTITASYKLQGIFLDDNYGRKDTTLGASYGFYNNTDSLYKSTYQIHVLKNPNCVRTYQVTIFKWPKDSLKP